MSYAIQSARERYAETVFGCLLPAGSQVTTDYICTTTGLTRQQVYLGVAQLRDWGHPVANVYFRYILLDDEQAMRDAYRRRIDLNITMMRRTLMSLVESRASLLMPTDGDYLRSVGRQAVAGLMQLASANGTTG